MSRTARVPSSQTAARRALDAGAAVGRLASCGNRIAAAPGPGAGLLASASTLAKAFAASDAKAPRTGARVHRLEAGRRRQLCGRCDIRAYAQALRPARDAQEALAGARADILSVRRRAMRRARADATIRAPYKAITSISCSSAAVSRGITSSRAGRARPLSAHRRGRHLLPERLVGGGRKTGLNRVESAFRRSGPIASASPFTTRRTRSANADRARSPTRRARRRHARSLPDHARVRTSKPTAG